MSTCPLGDCSLDCGLKKMVVLALRMQDSRPLGDGEGLAALNGFYFNRLGINPDNFDVYVVAVEDVAVATPDESASKGEVMHSAVYGHGRGSACV